ncbi:uncharacterized protein LOC108699800 [Xenopus laevis]|uniref:Uncharacterized protein LOC108699800 n=1 Tax=Xenopus laevis TaxID=8355 RepID=A0A8J1LLC8_XENLA|nr:uncharacterized protein LOC108699800 [Xenopus laevis]
MAAYHCCVPFCNSDSRYNADKKISFHRIPAFHVEPQRHRDWLNRIRREPGPTFKISSCTRVCSKHFLPSDFVRTLTGKRNLKPSSVPCIFQWTNNQEMEHETPISKRTVKNTLQPILPTQVQAPKSRPSITAERTVSVLDHCYDLPPKTDTEMLHAAREEIARLQQRSSALEKNRFFVERFSSDSSLINFYTGFKDYSTFTDVFTTLTQAEGNMVKWQQCQHECNTSDLDEEEESLLLIDQFFLFLCKVRQGFFDQDLAVRFNICQSTVTKIIITWADYLYLVLGEVPLWRSRAAASQDIPDCFRASYPQARLILHSAEFKVQTSNPSSVSSQLYSCYRSQTTYKGLLGIAPHGAVIFISPLYSSCASKRDITKSSGILDLLEPNDLVITDTDFHIQDLVEAAGAVVVIPPIITTAGSPEDYGEATVMLTQSSGEQNTMIILAPSVEDDQETLLVTTSAGLEDAVVELGQSAEEDEVDDIVPEEKLLMEHSTTMEDVSEDHHHAIIEAANPKENFKDNEAAKVAHYTREEVVESTQEPEKVVGDGAGLDKEINTLARLRICIDQDIERVRQYHLFDKVLPFTLTGVANQIWAVCAMLTNINGSLS